MHRILRYFHVLLLLFFYAQALYAQVNVDLLYKLKISGEYDSNLYLTPEDEDSDWAFLVNPSVALDISTKSTKSLLSYSASIYNYFEKTEDNYIGHDAMFNFSHELTKRLIFNVYNKYNVTQKLYDVNVNNENTIYSPSGYTIRREREYHSSYSGAIMLNYQFGKRDKCYVGYNHYRNWEQGENTEEATRYNPVAGVNFEIFEHTFLNLDISYIKGDFYGGSDDFDELVGTIKITREITKHMSINAAYSHTYMDYSGDTADYQVYSPSLGIFYRISKDSSLDVSAGYYEEDKEKGDDEKGLNLDVNYNKKWKIKKGNISFKYSSGYEETYFGGENLGFTIYHGGQLTFVYDFTRHLSNSAYLDYRYNKYTDQEPDRKDNVLSFKDELNYKVTKWMDVSISYLYRVLESNIDNNDYKDHRAMISIVLHDSKKLIK
ncbi:hypothetical protein JCM12298_16130 [Desulfothermus naphthae]